MLTLSVLRAGCPAIIVTAVGVGVLVGAAVYYFHDDGLEVQVPARVAHHVDLEHAFLKAKRIELHDR